MNISIDGGKTFCTTEEAVEFLTADDGMDFDTLGYYMNDDEAFSQVMTELNSRVFTANEFIKRYLELAKNDLIIE